MADRSFPPSPTPYAALFAGAPDAVLVADEAGRYVDANRAAEALLGYPREELLRLGIADVAANGPAWSGAEYARYVAAGQWQGDLELRRKDGSTVVVEAWAVVVPGSAGPVYASFLRDAAGRRSAESRLRSLLANAPDGVVLLDAAGSVTYASPAVERVLGYAPEAFAGAPRFDLVHPDDAAGVRARFAEVAATPCARATVEVRVRHADGGWRWVETTTSNLLGDPAVAGFVVNLHDVTARRLAEEALAAERDLLQSVLDQLPDAVYVKDAESRFLRLNRACAAALGVADPADAIGRTDHDFFPADLAAEFLADERSVLGHGQPLLNKPERQDQATAGRSVLASKVPLRDRDGRIRGMIGITRDVTDRAQADAALRESEARLRAVWDASSDAIALSDPDGIVIAANPAYLALYGFAEEEVVGRRFSVIFPEEQRAWADEQYRVAFVEPDPPPAYEARVRRRDGTVRDVEARAGFVVVDGERVGLVSTVRDVTEVREAQADRLRLAAVVEAAEDAILSKDLDGTVRSWNAAAERIYGWSAAEMVGQPIATVVPPERRAELADILGRIGRGERVERLETVRVAKDGRRLDLELSVSPVRAPDGRVVGASAIARDVGDRKRAEAALRAGKEAADRANRLKSEFLSAVSHELRTPLTAIIGYADLLLGGFDDPLSPAQEADVRRILAGGERLLDLVNDILDLSKLEAGRLDVAAGPVDLAWVATAACGDLAPQAAAKGLDLTVELPPDLPAAAGDGRRVRQILADLLGNAVKFTERGRVAVSARVPGDGTVDLMVADTGIGIVAEDLPRVFEEFWQADGSTTRAYGGTGLGLAMARKLAELQGGTIVAKSTPGEGSTFTLVLPVAPPASPAEQGPASAPDGARPANSGHRAGR